eukprot:TRINITY_DN22743_c0_g1_i1.p1 TRINITY_DN22743_c0_g1~~TRINITY_DN22743_c0_g1_i1.p1  ORF type:complete len:1216 (-),score=345.97 TRINITY_DN22743_c0_g1_i1:109-3756(-)
MTEVQHLWQATTAAESAAGPPVAVRLRHFPTSWRLREVVQDLPTRISELLTRFGPLQGMPEIVPGTELDGPYLTATACFANRTSAQAAASALHGVDWRSPEEVQQDDGRQPEKWERLWVQEIAVPSVEAQVATSDFPALTTHVSLVSTAGASTDVAPADDDEPTEPSSAPPSPRAEDYQPGNGSAGVVDSTSCLALKRCLRMRHFPASWRIPTALPQLAERITGVLSRFGPLQASPEIIAGPDGAGPDLTAVAEFEHPDAARAAREELHGFDWRSPEDVELSGGQPAQEWERFWAQEEASVSAMKVAEQADAETPFAAAAGAAAALAVLRAAREEEEDVDQQLQEPSPVVGCSEEHACGDDNASAWTTRPWMDDAQQSHLLIRGLPTTVGELQVQLLFTSFGGVDSMRLVQETENSLAAYVRLRNPDNNLHAVAAQLQGAEVEAAFGVSTLPGEPSSLSCELVLDEADRRKFEEVAEAERLEREAAEELRGLVTLSEEAKLLANTGLCSEDQQKRLESAADALTDPSVSKQRRRMLSALLEAERRRQEPHSRDREQVMMRRCDAESTTFRWEVKEAERLRKQRELEAEAAETEAMDRAEEESRQAEEVRIALENRRRQKELAAEAAQRKAMARADLESRMVQEARALVAARAREKDERRRMLDEERRQKRTEAMQREREASEQSLMEAEEVWRRQLDKELERLAEEERKKQHEVLAWRKKRELARKQLVDSDEEMHLEDDVDEDEAKDEGEQRSDDDERKADRERQNDMGTQKNKIRARESNGFSKNENEDKGAKRRRGILQNEEDAKPLQQQVAKKQPLQSMVSRPRNSLFMDLSAEDKILGPPQATVPRNCFGFDLQKQKKEEEEVKKRQEDERRRKEEELAQRREEEEKRRKDMQRKQEEDEQRRKEEEIDRRKQKAEARRRREEEEAEQLRLFEEQQRRKKNIVERRRQQEADEQRREEDERERQKEEARQRKNEERERRLMEEDERCRRKVEEVELKEEQERKRLEAIERRKQERLEQKRREEEEAKRKAEEQERQRQLEAERRVQAEEEKKKKREEERHKKEKEMQQQQERAKKRQRGRRRRSSSSERSAVATSRRSRSRSSRRRDWDQRRGRSGFRSPPRRVGTALYGGGSRSPPRQGNNRPQRGNSRSPPRFGGNRSVARRGGSRSPRRRTGGSPRRGSGGDGVGLPTRRHGGGVTSGDRSQLDRRR